MHKTTFALFILIGSFIGLSAQNIQPPAAFLGYELGENFTYHHRVVAYFEYIDKVSDKVKLLPYGHTNEGRPLITAILTSPENHKNLDQNPFKKPRPGRI